MDPPIATCSESWVSILSLLFHKRSPQPQQRPIPDAFQLVMNIPRILCRSLSLTKQESKEQNKAQTRPALMSIPIPIIIIGGQKRVSHLIRTDSFLCPRCRKEQRCKHKEYWVYAHLFFVPFCPIRKLASYVKCTGCKSRFDPSVMRLADEVARERKKALDAALEGFVASVVAPRQALWIAAMRTVTADGQEVTKEELSVLKEVLQPVSNPTLDDAIVLEEITNFQTAAANNPTDSIKTDLEPLVKFLDEPHKESIITGMLRVAQADGKINRREQAVLDSAATTLGMPSERVQHILQKTSDRDGCPQHGQASAGTAVKHDCEV